MRFWFLFDAIVDGRSGVTFTEDAYDDAWTYVIHDDNKFPLIIPELVEALVVPDPAAAAYTSDEFPSSSSPGSGARSPPTPSSTTTPGA